MKSTTMKNTILLMLLLLSVFTGSATEGYTIYPVPQQQVMQGGEASFTSRVSVIAEPGIDQVTIERAVQVLSEHGLAAVVTKRAVKGVSTLLLGVSGSRGIADKNITALKLDRAVFGMPKYDRHILNLTSQDGVAHVTILGENTDAAFCGLASLEQMLDRGTGNLPCVTLYDWADIRNRGIIEGYYGVPYTAQVTKDLFRFMARYKMNTYMYGAKSDPYHSRYWDAPYPTTISAEQLRIGYLTQEMMSDITSVAHATKVNFIWAIHPGKAFADPAQTDVLDRIMAKFESMHSLGVRQFGVFVDDVGVPSDPAILKLCADNLSALQQRIDMRWNKADAMATDTVKPLHYVPQLYAFSWVNRDRGREFFESLGSTPEKLNIYITGRDVWSVPNNEDQAIVKNWLGREVSWWWNYPCNDQDPTKLFVMDTYTNFRDETHINSLSHIEKRIKGLNTLIINPMQQGELSKIALFGVADYSWNSRAFDNYENWEAAVVAVVGNERAQAFKKIAPYLRYYDNDAIGYKIDRYHVSIERKHPSHAALLAELREVNAACKEIEAMEHSASESDRLFYADVRPWLLKIDDMTAEAIALFDGKNPAPGNYTDNPRYRFESLGGMGAHISLRTLTAEPSAQRLPELLKWLHEQDTIK
jgi:hyaluronoglucosaminidase